MDLVHVQVPASQQGYSWGARLRGHFGQTLDDSSQYVYDASDRKYDASTSADMDLNSASGSDSVFFNDINLGNTVRGELPFDMPAGLKAVKAELHDSAFSGGVTVNLR